MAIEMIDYHKCTHCRICIDSCPTAVFRMIGKRVYISRGEDCQTCFLCEIDCPEDAIYVGPERGTIGGQPIPLPY